MEENLKNSLLPPGLAHYVLKPKERFEVCHQRFSPPGDGRPLPRLSMECKPLIEKQLWNSIVIFIWVHFFFWKKMHLQQHLLLLNHKNLSSCLVLGLWHFRTFNNNFFWSIPLVCRCSKVEIGFSGGQLPGSFGVLLSRWLCWVRGALNFFWKNLGFRSNQAVRDIWKTFFQPPEVCELCYELPMTRLRQGARSAFQIVSSSYM